MKYRPYILILISAFHCLAPIGNWYLNAMWAQMSFFEYVSVFFQPQNISRQWPHVLLPIIAGIAIYACKKWSFFVYLLCMLGLLLASYFGYNERSGTISVLPIILAYSLNLIIVTYFLVPAVRKVYFDPRLRWWETLPRYSCNILANVKDHGKEFSGQITNFSEGGLFFQPNYRPDDEAEIIISFEFEGMSYDFNGTVIHHGMQKSAGFGVKFIPTLRQKQNAAMLAKVLADQGNLIVTRQSKDENFFQWLKRVCKTGKGLLPEINKRS